MCGRWVPNAYPSILRVVDMVVWKGALNVDPNYFSIEVERLIYENGLDRISFDWRGRVYESGARYTLSGKAARQKEGHFLSSAIEYKTGEVDCEAVIYFLVVAPLDDGLYVEGFWHETNEGPWKFSDQLGFAESFRGGNP